MSEMIAIEYNDIATAKMAREKIFDLQRQGLISVRDAAVVDVDANGKVRMHQAASATGAGAASGALWGGLIGLLFLAPFIGMAIGAGTGALAGKSIDVGVDDKFMKDLGSSMQPGMAALFLLVDQVTIDKVVDEMATMQLGGKLLRSSLSNEAEQRLNEAVDAARLAHV
ncbi:DUF1269 domain-containing protein [Dactylosporangium aurantiacum]|uniref:DUF1269 domain-containing protein n=1 Tax=Dactylosporangium aurantiacum TaxID=35754 RepID=A0A9Q9MJD1_9ACTN|nr:DUF1269 domain-containing protein [Dactylosporangium aurantiacum]MDG6103912.1 DUF1269 domain-containing protein [Dactylosporangium aurantiacum]UWZ58899.1 DUF1269 domain-containing protein [Dactylosporangium aurantiacum]